MSNNEKNNELVSEDEISNEEIVETAGEAEAEFAEPVAKSEKQIRKKEKLEQHEKEKQKKLALKAKKQK